MSLSFQHFGGEVGHRSTEGPGTGVGVEHSFLGESEVGEEGVSILVEHYVLRLEVPEDDVLLVEFFQGQDDLTHVQFGLALRELRFLLQVVP